MVDRSRATDHVWGPHWTVTSSRGPWLGALASSNVVDCVQGSDPVGVTVTSATVWVPSSVTAYDHVAHDAMVGQSNVPEHEASNVGGAPPEPPEPDEPADDDDDVDEATVVEPDVEPTVAVDVEDVVELEEPVVNRSSSGDSHAVRPTEATRIGSNVLYMYPL